MPYSTNVNIRAILESASGNHADTMEARFFNNGGVITMTPAAKSHYAGGTVVNGQVQPGTIYIGAASVDGYALLANITPNEAAKAIAIHELGHAFYAQRSYENQPGNNATIDAKAAWCLEREGMATAYAFKVALESGFHVVAGTTANPNLYQKMATALAGLDPRGYAFSEAAINFATAQFNADDQYRAYCRKPESWATPSYVAPAVDDSGNGGGYGGAGGSTFGGYRVPPEPGGYWTNLQPHTSDRVETPPPGTDSMAFLPYLDSEDFVETSQETDVVSAPQSEAALLVGVSPPPEMYF